MLKSICSHPFWRSAVCRSLAGAGFLLLAVGLLTGGRTSAAVGLFTAPWDKLAHITTFALASGLLALVMDARSAGRLLLVLLCALALGAADELQQAILPGRHGDWQDFSADVAGALMGLLLVRRLFLLPGAVRA